MHPSNPKDAQNPWRKESPSLNGRILDIGGSIYDDVLFACGENGAILRSQDQGKTWKKLETRSLLISLIEPNSNPTIEPKLPDLYAVWESPTHEVFVAGYGGIILRSTNHGDSWQSLSSNTKATFYDIYGIQNPESRTSASRLLSSERIFAIGTDGTVVFSDDGATWEPLYSGSQWALWAIWGDPQGLYIAGEFGTLLFSEDRGKSWEPIETDTQNTLKSLWSDVDGGVFVAGDRLALHSKNKQPFQQFVSPSSSTQVIWGSPEGTVFVGTPEALLYRRAESEALNRLWMSSSEEIEGIWGRSEDEVYFWTDAGSVYLRTPDKISAQSLHISEDLRGVSSSKKSTYIVGDDGTILIQTKSGWTRQTIEDNPSQNLYAFWEEPGEMRYIVGQYGVLSSAFQSEVWQAEYISQDPLLGIFGAPGIGIFAVGERGTIIRTQDAGATWEEIPIEDTLRADLTSGTITQDDAIYIVGSDAMLLRSTDNGQSFDQLRLPQVQNFDTQDLLSVVSDPDGTLWISGYGYYEYRDAKHMIQRRPDAVIWKIPKGDIKQAQMTTLETASTAHSIWRAPDGRLYVSATRSILSTKDGSSWKVEMTIPDIGGFRALGGNAKKIYAVGKDGLIWSK